MDDCHPANGTEKGATEDAVPVTSETACLQSVAPVTHPSTAEIIRQVDFYFSDGNLPYDAHLLGLFKEGKGSVSLNEICGFKKMRRFKPRKMVVEALRQSTFVVVSEDGKRLMRKHPFDVSRITVIPKISEDRKKKVIPEDQPWLTKGLLKPTGFEDGVTNGPIKPEEYERNLEDYDLEISFPIRIETAITRYCANRKMHSKTRKIFDKFMVFGGMACGRGMFTGGFNEREMEDYTMKEIAAMTSYYGVAERVLDGHYEDSGDDGPTWTVDFEAVAKAFFSSEFLDFFDWYDDEEVKNATNVLRNFYNYLLLHDVCPEFKSQLLAARKVCDMAEEELPKLREVDRKLPGGFNTAASRLFGGYYANLFSSYGDWVLDGDQFGWSKENADLIFTANVFAHGAETQLLKMEDVRSKTTSFKVISEDELGLEIVSIELATGPAMAIYTDPKFSNTIVRPMGMLHCKRWEVPNAAPLDLPQSIKDEMKAQHFEFLVEEETLKCCIPGMKIECCVKELDLGITWIDYIEKTYPSFHTWLPNERIREWKEPGPPTAWMHRQNCLRNGEDADAGLDGLDQGEGEVPNEDQDGDDENF